MSAVWAQRQDDAVGIFFPVPETTWNKGWRQHSSDSGDATQHDGEGMTTRYSFLTAGAHWLLSLLHLRGSGSWSGELDPESACNLQAQLPGCKSALWLLVQKFHKVLQTVPPTENQTVKYMSPGMKVTGRWALEQPPSRAVCGLLPII